jgi:hypothetical protein
MVTKTIILTRQTGNVLDKQKTGKNNGHQNNNTNKTNRKCFRKTKTGTNNGHQNNNTNETNRKCFR